MSRALKPDDFVIKRRRKKYKFAKFANFENCFESFDFDKPESIKDDTSCIIEIGAGDGSFSLELARRYPAKFFVAVDVKADRLVKSAEIAQDEHLPNVVFVRAHADQLIDLVKSQSLEAVWLNFSDPYPKKRHAKRRLTGAHFLDIYAGLLRSEGSLFIKHDNLDFFAWSLEQLIESGWILRELSFDLYQSSLNDDYKIPTAYERRWLAEGRTTYFVSARR